MVAPFSLPLLSYAQWSERLFRPKSGASAFSCLPSLLFRSSSSLYHDWHDSPVISCISLLFI